MDITDAATQTYIVNNPSIGATTYGIAPAAEEDWISQQGDNDDLIFVRWSDRTLSAVYIDDGTEVTGRTPAHDALDEFIANGGTIDGYSPTP